VGPPPPTQYPKENQPQKPTGPDPKWRYFWRVGERPKETKFPELNEAQVVPAGTCGRWLGRRGDRPATAAHACAPPRAAPRTPLLPAFPQWSEVCDRWGRLMHDTVWTVAEMAAVGLGLPRDAITRRAHQGPHLLAPTGSDLNVYGKLGQIFAGYGAVRASGVPPGRGLLTSARGPSRL